MAARLRKLHQDEVRAKIKTSQLINRLESHVLEGLELSQSQVSAAMGLIKKTLPDLSAVTLNGPEDADGNPTRPFIEIRLVTPETAK